MKRRQSSKGGAIVIGTGGTRSTKSTSCQSPASPLCFAWTGRDLNSSTLVRVILFILDVYLSTTLGWCCGNAEGDGDNSNSLEYRKILLEPLCASDLSQPSHAPTFINSAFFHDFSHSTRYHIVPLLDSTSMTCKGVVNSLQASSISSSEVNLGVLQTPESFIFVFIIFPNTYLLLLQAMLYVNIHHYKGLWVKLLLSIVLCLTLLMMLCRRT